MDKFGGRVLSPGERLALLAPHFERQSDQWKQFDKERFRVGVRVCFCSTLDDCWTLSAWGYKLSRTDETPHCPAPSASTFAQ